MNLEECHWFYKSYSTEIYKQHLLIYNTNILVENNIFNSLNLKITTFIKNSI